MSRRTYKSTKEKTENQNPNIWSRFSNWLFEKDHFGYFILFLFSTSLGIIIYFYDGKLSLFLLPLVFFVFSVIFVVIVIGIIYLSECFKRWFPNTVSASVETHQQSVGPSKESVRSHRNKGLAGVVGLVMKADGLSSRKELEAVASYLKSHYKSDDYNEIMDALKVNLKINNTNFVKQSCIWLTADMDYSERLGFVEFLFDIARLSQGIDKAEWELLFDIMHRITIDEEDIDYFSRKYASFYNRDKKTNSDELKVNYESLSALHVLGLDETATLADIQSAYRILAKKYHPDTVQDADMKLVLTEKFKELSKAYSVLCR